MQTVVAAMQPGSRLVARCNYDSLMLCPVMRVCVFDVFLTLFHSDSRAMEEELYRQSKISVFSRIECVESDASSVQHPRHSLCPRVRGGWVYKCAGIHAVHMKWSMGLG